VSEDRDSKPCYVARHSCGGAVMLAVKPDDDDVAWKRSTAKEIMACVQRGYSIETMPVSEARKTNLCECQRSRKKKNND
jgi:hypothetical protein